MNKIDDRQNIFLIRNFFCIISAETIILQYKISNPIAYIINRDGNNWLVDAIQHSLNPSIWKNIKIIDLSLQKKSFNSKQKVAIIQSVLSNAFIKDCPNSIFITVTNDNIEKYTYFYAKKNKICLNKYEEGMNHYANPRLLENTSLLKRLLRYIRYPNNHFVLINECKCTYNNVYSFFPNYYRKNDYKRHFQLDFVNTNNEITKKQKVSVLLITGPYSDSGEMTEEEEFSLYKKMLDLVPRGYEIVIKPHPRENIKKVESFCQLYNCKMIDEKYQNLPVEILITKNNFEYILGIWTSTLLYATKLSNKSKIISCVKTLIKKFSSLEDTLNMFSNEGVICI